MSARTGHWLMVAAGVVVLATVAAAVRLMDSPSHERAERMDGKRVDDLRTLSSLIAAHADVHEQLPARLSVVARGPGPDIVDPGTGRPYEYEVTGEWTYRLCATFETAGNPAGRYGAIPGDWRHDAGRQCFDRDVDPVAGPDAPAGVTP